MPDNMLKTQRVKINVLDRAFVLPMDLVLLRMVVCAGGEDEDERTIGYGPL